jgi:hypothetical protein
MGGLDLDRGAVMDRCETLDGTVRSMHYYQNVAPIGRPVWVCANCGCQR